MSNKAKILAIIRTLVASEKEEPGRAEDDLLDMIKEGLPKHLAVSIRKSISEKQNKTNKLCN